MGGLDPPFELARIISECECCDDNYCQELNMYLTDKVFFVGHRLSLADILLYRSLHRIFVSCTINLLIVAILQC